MKNILGFLFIILFTLIVARPGQAATPFKPNKSEFILGRAGETSSSLSFYFDDVLGPQINVTSGSQTFDLTAPLNVTGNVSGVDANFTGDASFASGTFSGVLSIGGNDTTFGDGLDSDKKFIFDIGAGASNPYMGYNSATGKTVFNNGLAEKPFGSGSGSGGSGGVNLLTNESFEDIGSGNPILDWTNSGGTLTQETFANGTEADSKFARFVASGAGQYLESDLVTIPEDFSFGMMADVRYTSGSSAFDLVILDSTETITYSSSSFSDLLEWDKKPTDTFKRPAAGTQIKFRVVSTGAGTIDLNSAYLGSNKGFISGDKFNEFSFRIILLGGTDSFTGSGVGVSCSRFGLGQYDCNFTGLTSRPNCTAINTLESDIGGTVVYNQVTATNTFMRFNSATENGSAVDSDILVKCNKTGADSVSSQEAFTPEQANFFISANIGGNGVAPSLITSTTPITISHPSLDMVLNNGSAKIPCTGNNPATGLTCSSGDEVLGINFKAPVAGRYRVCTSLAQVAVGNVALRLATTLGDSETIIEQGRSIAYGGGYPAGPICEIFNMNTGENTVRLFYESTGSGISFPIDRNTSLYERDMNITVEMVGNNVSKPQIINQVDSFNKNGVKGGHCIIQRSGSSTSFDTSDGDCSFIVSTVDCGSGCNTITTDTSGYKCHCSPMDTGDCGFTTAAGGQITAASFPNPFRVYSYTTTAASDDKSISLSCTRNR